MLLYVSLNRKQFGNKKNLAFGVFLVGTLVIVSFPMVSQSVIFYTAYP